MYNTVICIPFRNRQRHLDYFLEHSLPLLVKHMPDVHLVVVEQSDDSKLFNRGALLNVAIQEYKDKTVYCMTHDVDTNPMEETILNYYRREVEENAVMGIYTAECNTLGGTIKFRPATVIECNGFPSNFWGWGGEDKSLQNRCEYYGKTITKNILANDPNRDSFFKIFDDIQDKHKSDELGAFSIVEYGFHNLTKEVQEEYIHYSGINTLAYKILETKTPSPYVTHILVELQ